MHGLTVNERLTSCTKINMLLSACYSLITIRLSLQVTKSYTKKKWNILHTITILQPHMAYSHIAMVIGIQEICRLIKGCGIKKRQSKLHTLTTTTSVLQTYFNTIILLWIIRASPTGSSVTLNSPTRNTRGANGTFELSLPPFFNRFQVEYGKKIFTTLWRAQLPWTSSSCRGSRTYCICTWLKLPVMGKRACYKIRNGNGNGMKPIRNCACAIASWFLNILILLWAS